MGWPVNSVQPADHIMAVLSKLNTVVDQTDSSLKLQGSGDYAGFEVDLAVEGAEIHMVARGEGELARRAPSAHFHVVGFAHPRRHRFMRDIGYMRQKILELKLERFQRLLAFAEPIAQIRDRGQQRLDIFTARFRLAYRFALGVAFGLQGLGVDLQLFTPGFEGLISLEVELEAAGGERQRDRFGVGAQSLRVEHGVRSAATGRIGLEVKEV
jgi:hypothetical protein